MLIVAVFAGLTLPTGQNAAMHEATGQNSGLASGVQNTMLQIGGGLGLAVLVTLAIRQFHSAVDNGIPPAVAATEGYALAFRVAAGVVLLSAVLVLAFLRHEKPEPSPRADPVPSPADTEGLGTHRSSLP